MTYNEFKTHFYKRIVNEFGFKKEDKIYRYRNEEVVIVFSIEKSSYSNSVSFFGIGISPLEMLIGLNLTEPKIALHSDMIISLNKNDYIELDDMNSFEKYDKIINDFFEETFPKLLNVENLKKMIKYDELGVRDYVKEFWNIK